MKIYFNLISIFCLLIFSNMTNAKADEKQFLGDNSRWSIDLASRVLRNTDTNQNSYINAVGLDIHKVFSNSTSDIGTLMFQPYLVKLNNVKNPSFTFDDGNDTQLTWRIANFNYTAINQGKFNIRLGHFEVPYGLEYQIDTNGTLRQLTASDRGIKADWGFSVNGIMPSYEYEVALTRGSGNEITSQGDPYIFSGRIGTPSIKNFVTGFSWFTGDVYNGSGVTKRNKLGVDVSYYYYQWQFMTETSVGETAGNSTLNSFAEALWRNSREDFSAYVQLGYQGIGESDDLFDISNSSSHWIAGIQWLSSNCFDISAQYKHKIQDAPSVETSPMLSVQIRYRM